MFIFLLFLLSLFFWFCSKKVLAISCFYLVLTGVMSLKVFSGTILEIHNYVFLFTNIVLLNDFYHGTLQQNMKTDKLLRLLVYGYVIFLMHCLMTIILGLDSIRYATGVLRVDISALLLYFIARKLNKQEIYTCLKYICIITVIHCFFYLLQYLGINVFIEKNHLDESSILRIGMPPALPLLFLLSLFVLKKWKLAALYVIPIFTAAARGMLVALVTAFVLFYRKYLFKSKYIIPIVVGSAILYGVYNNYLADDAQRYDVSFTEEIIKGFDYKTLTDYSAYAGNGHEVFSFKENGTFAFRISMLVERLVYLLNNPQYLPFGIGMVAEESPHNNYSFFLGTANEDTRNGYCMIVSNDIVWVSVVLRYGLFGIIFWILFIKQFFKTISLNKTSVWASVGYIYTIFFIFNSFGSDGVVRSSWLLPFFLLLSYCNQGKRELCKYR